MADIIVGESRVNYAEWLGVPREQGWGTADIVAIVGTELQVHDYKHGMGVEVDAEGNEQMMLYAGGALLEYQDLTDIQTVRMVIHQPRIKAAPSEWTISVVDLKRWLAEKARTGAMSVQAAEHTYQGQVDAEWQKTFLQPTEKGCRWCKAKATCPAKREADLAAVFGGPAPSVDDFPSAELPPVNGASEDAWLAVLVKRADEIEDFLKAVRAEVDRRLHEACNSVEAQTRLQQKLVRGKRGARAWNDPEAAEQVLKAMRLKQEEMYDFKLISPTTAEKLAETRVIGPRQWPKLQALIVQPEGKIHVAPLSDKRPAIEIKPVVDEFEAAPDAAPVDIDSLV